MLDDAFDVLGVYNLLLPVHADNERGIRACRRAGFRQTGRRRKLPERAVPWWTLST
jgi:RimJ/RimL family protein N-acetyltransferase